ncbi:hypothetical protein MAMMFC1_03266 [Methylomusa anaerophila]|uniref:Uncharacterized protein n=1 Tax=Methylomusa anaerophila TaxID=1930071 RepID=A0A348ANC3_9FIRM|nr:hypothetical protein MAMMFC1_03266 [Methylomusa anaerophila]
MYNTIDIGKKRQNIVLNITNHLIIENKGEAV